MIIDKNLVASELNKWFNTVNESNPHFWNRDVIGQVIKKNLIRLNRWKKKPRGNPRFGAKMGRYKKAVINQGYDGPPPNRYD